MSSAGSIKLVAPRGCKNPPNNCRRLAGEPLSASDALSSGLGDNIAQPIPFSSKTWERGYALGHGKQDDIAERPKLGGDCGKYVIV